MTHDMDELSRSIDELNAGRQPEPTRLETAELLSVALLLKKAGLPAQPPAHLLEAAVQRAAEGMQADKTNRRSTWIYSGVLGAAASLLLFLGIHGLPDWQSETSTAIPPSSQSTQSAITAPAPVQITEQPLRSQAPTDPKPSPAAPSAAIQAPVAPEPRVAAPRPAPPPSAKASPPPAPAPSTAAPALKSAPQTPLIVALRLPGRTPDSTAVDLATGALRQTFGRGTPQEIVITQSLPTQSDSAATNQPGIYASREAGSSTPAKTAQINKVTVNIAGQEVTLEGRQSRRELLDLAATLMP